MKNVDNNFYSEVVTRLKEEAKMLNEKLKIHRESENMNLYIANLKSLRETLNLISKYDWRLHYSEYSVIDDNGNEQRQVSIWEQNHDGQIKNHKYWNVDGVGVSVLNI